MPIKNAGALSEMLGIFTQQLHGLKQAEAAKKAELDLASAPASNLDPPTSLPSVEDGTRPASTGEQNAANASWVTSDVAGGGVDAAKTQSGTLEGDQRTVGVQATSTGVGPQTEPKSQSMDPGTAGPYRVDQGEKYSSVQEYREAVGQMQKLANAMLQALAAPEQTPVPAQAPAQSQEKTAEEIAQEAAMLGWQMAGLQSNTKEAFDQLVQADIAQRIMRADSLADKVAAFVLAHKKAEDEEGEEEDEEDEDESGKSEASGAPPAADNAGSMADLGGGAPDEMGGGLPEGLDEETLMALLAQEAGGGEDIAALLAGGEDMGAEDAAAEMGGEEGASPEDAAMMEAAMAEAGLPPDAMMATAAQYRKTAALLQAGAIKAAGYGDKRKFQPKTAEQMKRYQVYRAFANELAPAIVNNTK